VEIVNVDSLRRTQVDTGVRQFCANEKARLQGCADEDNKRSSLHHIERSHGCRNTTNARSGQFGWGDRFVQAGGAAERESIAPLLRILSV
jgi:hypothetical protein